MPITFHENIDQDTAIGLWQITESTADLEARLQLKAHELLLLNSLSNDKRNLHWLATRVLLRKMLNTNEYIDCQADQNGKPILINHPYFISLSHSYDYAAVMISKTKQVGIDIEIIKDKIVRVQNKFLNQTELDHIDEEARIEKLYVYWCAKEALYKLNGKKETSFKDHIHIKPFNYLPYGELSATIEKANTADAYRVHYKKIENYMLGYVCK
ncbi:4'-phosphopantetheinyl transferase superfamily protein [Pedobacter sp. SD-b]|uniref:4'-phosphopantetheinyl transferase superfamily protein n=1 Tax=Pedobacter segetis TaxID=2793069 RepID=A0ABS1BLF9_9SPHI|nr:4'-phosphopantetheinyl transferase superfamily protein [Pedobacter segetis]MBK0383730.1 4'-phosphopantetheinyl transferase superfamily protein [Pedobacter segetis]